MSFARGATRDIRSGIRSLRRHASFSAIAVLTLAIGIAANAVVFAVMKRVVLRPLPYGEADRLVTIAETDSRQPTADSVSDETVRAWRERSRAFDHISVYGDSGVRAIVGGRVEQLRGMWVSADFFETLGVPMYLGRSFRPGEDLPEPQNVLILTYGAWSELFGADPSIVGRSIPAVGGAYQVIGVLPPDFQPLHMTNPAELPRVFVPNGRHGGRVVARLAPGVTRGAAEAELGAIVQALRHERPDEHARDASARVTPLRDQIVGHFGTGLWLLQGAVLLLLLLACANVAMLLLARSIPRQREMAVRSALGARRWQLVRQMLTESVILAGAAGGLGVALAWMATRLIARTSTSNIPRIGELAPDSTMLVFGAAASAATAIVFGLLPAILDSRGSAGMLRMTPGATGQRAHQPIVHGLIAGELALAFVLVLAVGLLGKSYMRLMDVDPGFDPGHVLTVSLLPDGVHYPSQAKRLEYFDAVATRVRSIVGVQDAGYASTLPFSHPLATRVYIREHPVAHAMDAPSLDRYLVSPEFLDVMRIPVRRGRGFTAHDGWTAQPVALVSESAARAHFQGGDPIGQHIHVDSVDERRPWAVIVGIVADVHQYGLDVGPDAAIYLPFAQARPAQGWSSLAIRSAVPPVRIESAVRAAMIAVDPLQPVFHMQPMATFISLSLSQRTFILALIAIFGGLALVLACAGVFGVVSYLVEHRTRELGLRLALGATPADVSWMVVRQLLAVSAAGMTAGAVAWAAFTGTVSTLLFGISRLDVWTIAEVLLLLLLAALAASARPLSRAARLDPAIALRSE